MLRLCEDVADYVAGDSGETDVEPLEFHGEALVIDAEQVEHGGVKIVDTDRVFFGGVAKLVGGAVSDAGFDAASGHHIREALNVMIAAVTALATSGCSQIPRPK